MLEQTIRILLVGGEPRDVEAIRREVARHAPVEVVRNEDPGRASARALGFDPTVLVVGPAGDHTRLLQDLRMLRRSPLTQALPILARVHGEDAALHQSALAAGADTALPPSADVPALALQCIVRSVVGRVARERDDALEQVRRLTEALQEKDRRIRELTTADPLTGRPNRQAFLDRFAEEWQRAHRDQSNLGLLLVGVNHLRGWTRANGRAAGMELMRRLAEEIGHTARRPGDFVGRFAPDAFAIVLPDTTSSGVKDTGYRILERFRALAPGSDEGWPQLSVSLGGAAMRPVAGMEPAGQLARAEEALEQARLGGPASLVISAAQHLSLVETSA